MPRLTTRQKRHLEPASTRAEQVERVLDFISHQFSNDAYAERHGVITGYQNRELQLTRYGADTCPECQEIARRLGVLRD